MGGGRCYEEQSPNVIHRLSLKVQIHIPANSPDPVHVNIGGAFESQFQAHIGLPLSHAGPFAFRLMSGSIGRSVQDKSAQHSANSSPVGITVNVGPSEDKPDMDGQELGHSILGTATPLSADGGFRRLSFDEPDDVGNVRGTTRLDRNTRRLTLQMNDMDLLFGATNFIAAGPQEKLKLIWLFVGQTHFDLSAGHRMVRLPLCSGSSREAQKIEIVKGEGLALSTDYFEVCHDAAESLLATHALGWAIAKRFGPLAAIDVVVGKKGDSLLVTSAARDFLMDHIHQLINTEQSLTGHCPTMDLSTLQIILEPQNPLQSDLHCVMRLEWAVVLPAHFVPKTIQGAKRDGMDIEPVGKAGANGDLEIVEVVPVKPRSPRYSGDCGGCCLVM